VLCRGLEKNGKVRAWHGRGMASVNQTRLHCVNQMGKTHSKPLVARHGRETAWARHAMCESAFTHQDLFRFRQSILAPSDRNNCLQHFLLSPVMEEWFPEIPLLKNLTTINNVYNTIYVRYISLYFL